MKIDGILNLTPCLDYPGTHVIALHLTPAERGYNLSREGLPEKKPIPAVQAICKADV